MNEQNNRIKMMTYVTEKVREIKSDLSKARAKRREAVRLLREESGLAQELLDTFIDNDNKNYEIMRWQNNVMNSVLTSRNFFSSPNQNIKPSSSSSTLSTPQTASSKGNTKSPNQNIKPSCSSSVLTTPITLCSSKPSNVKHISKSSTIEITKLIDVKQNTPASNKRPLSPSKIFILS